jgi:hypothetical protein
MIDGKNYNLEKIARETSGEYLKVEPDVNGALRLVKAVK